MPPPPIGPTPAPHGQHRALRKGLTLSLICGSLASPASAQEGLRDFEIWNATLATAQLSSSDTGPSLWLDLHARRGDGAVFIARPALGFRLRPWLSLWAGYAWVPSLDAVDGRRSDEHRVWQQVILSPQLDGPVSFQARTRLEQRMGGGELGHRLREFVRSSWAPNKISLGVVAWDELFIGLNSVDWGPARGYDQNRLFTGVFLPARPWIRVEAGHLLVHLNRDSDRLMSAIAINLFVSSRPRPRGRE